MLKKIAGVVVMVAPVSAMAAAPAWVSTSIEAFKTDMTDILVVAAPLVLGIVAAFVGLRKVISLVRGAGK